MAELDDQLLTMEFELAFEVEKAVLNGDLELSKSSHWAVPFMLFPAPLKP